VAAATPYLRALRPLDGLCALLEEAARRRLDTLPLEAVVAPIAALEAGELLARVRHLRPRLVPDGEVPAPEVAERIVRMSAEELGELGQREDALALRGSQRGSRLRVSAASGTAKAAGRAASSSSARLPAIAGDHGGAAPKPPGAAVPRGSAWVGRWKDPTAARSKTGALRGAPARGRVRWSA